MSEPSAAEDATSAREPAGVTIPRPDDWHLHLRDDDMLAAVVGWSARRFRHAIVMPNLRPPVTSTAAAAEYRNRIVDRVPAGSDFTPWMTLFASADIDHDDLRRGVEQGVIRAVKFYPAGATTNSDQAKGTLTAMAPLLEVMEDIGLRLLVHAESTDPAVDLFDREAVFLERHLSPAVDRFPGLAFTLEHVSTAAGVDFVRAHDNVAATITPHHLARQRNDLLAHGMKPDLFCKPVINSEDDRQVLIAAATSGEPGFFLGTDSAPHPTTAKYGPTAAAGVFSAPYGLEATAEVFHQAGALNKLATFVSYNGAAVMGVEPAATHVRVERTPPPGGAPAEELTTESGDTVVFFGGAEAARWTVTELTD